jgi:signal transduction histidine kinase
MVSCVPRSASCRRRRSSEGRYRTRSDIETSNTPRHWSRRGGCRRLCTRKSKFVHHCFTIYSSLAATLLLSNMLFAVARVIAGRFGLVGWVGAIPGLFVLAAAGVIVTVMIGAARRFASPLGAVMDAADRVAEGDYGVRVPEYGPPPMRALAHSFNTMTERLQNADRLRRDLMADVAHELRTPLSVLQGRLERLLDGVYPRDDPQISQLLDETHVLSRLIEDLRTLALSDAGALQLQKEPTDLVSLVQDVVRSMRTEATRTSVVVHLTTPAETVVLDLDAL